MPGRSEFLDAATVLQKARTFLETRRTDIDREIEYYRAAEDKLVILGEADRLRENLEADIAAKNEELAGLNKKIDRAAVDFEADKARMAGDVAMEKAKTESIIAIEVERQAAVKRRVAELEQTLSDAERNTADSLAELAAKIEERETALTSIREHIAKLAQM